MNQIIISDRTFLVFDWKQAVGYFRIKGYGLWLGTHRRFPALFSERYGYVKAFHVGDFCLRILKPESAEQ